MKMVKLLQLSGWCVLAFISACRHKPKDGLTDTYTSGVMAIAADESFRPVCRREIDVFEGLFSIWRLLALCDGSRSYQPFAQG